MGYLQIKGQKAQVLNLNLNHELANSLLNGAMAFKLKQRFFKYYVCVKYYMEKQTLSLKELYYLVILDL